RLVHALLDRDETGETFALALRDLHDLSLRCDVAARLRGEGAARRLHAAWRDTAPDSRTSQRHAWAPTVADAVWASDLVEHLLRPLWATPPEARLTHSVSNGLAALVGMAAKWVHGTPFLLTEHGVYLRERYLAALEAGAHSRPVRSLLLRFYRLLTGATYAVADLVAPVCEYNLRWQLRCGADPASVRPVHNGVDPDRFSPGFDEPDEPTLAWVGRVDPLKDVETLIRAFGEVRRRMGGVRLRMFGPTPPGNEWYRERCERLIADLGLEGAATFEGRAASVRAAYHAGHVVVLSSVSEAFPYTVIEAMASGRPTVSTDVGGVREAVGDAGLVVPPRDPGAIAAACLDLLGDPGRRRHLGRAARERVLTQFTLQRFLHTYRDVYDGLDELGGGIADPDAAPVRLDLAACAPATHEDLPLRPAAAPSLTGLRPSRAEAA
ncbi:MAG: GT4 family glycosyltransferase PelF, partial [Actinomycetota bacterium]